MYQLEHLLEVRALYLLVGWLISIRCKPHESRACTCETHSCMSSVYHVEYRGLSVNIW